MEQIAHYQVTGKIGSGAMGDVYHARDTKLNREVAIKVLPERFAGDEASLGRFEREAQMLAALHHPHIATIFGIEDIEGSKAIILEFVEGETLQERLMRGSLELAEALPIFQQIASALEAAHEKGIVHRDLKPGNIKFTAEGDAKVLDFGLAKAVEDARTESSGATELDAEAPTLPMETTTPGMVLGTPAYMSPEQARGEVVDKRTDVWAFGCCLYETLTGRKPFRGQTVTDMMAEILKSDPDFTLVPVETPHDIISLLRRCLEKDPRRRLRDLGDIAIRLEETVESTRIPARASVPASGAPTRGSKWNILVLIPGLVLIGVLAFLAARLLSPREPKPLPGTIRSLTVLPFKSYITDPREAGCGEMIAGLIKEGLSQIRDLQVVSGGPNENALRNSNLRYPELAEQLKVDAFVEGQLRKVGDQFEATALLIGPDGTTRWTETYGPDEIENLRRQIALAIAAEVGVNVLEHEERKIRNRKGTADPDAWNEFRKGVDAYNEFTDAGWTAAEAHFDNALDMDPGYADALGFRSSIPWLRAVFGGSNKDPEYSLEESSQILNKHKENARDQQRLELTQAWLDFYGDRDWDAAKRKFRQLARERPDIRGARTAYAEFLSCIEGRYDEAHHWVDLALMSEPDDLGHLEDKANIYWMSGNFEEAFVLKDKIWKRNSRSWNALIDTALLQVQIGRTLGPPKEAEYLSNAVQRAEQAVLESKNHVRSLGMQAFVLANSGQIEKATGSYENLCKELDTRKLYLDEGSLAMIEIALGNTDKALELLQQAADGKGRWSIITLRRPFFVDALGQLPEYWAIVDQLRFPELPYGHRYRELEQAIRYQRGK